MAGPQQRTAVLGTRSAAIQSPRPWAAKGAKLAPSFTATDSRGQLFDRLVTSELSKIVAENQPEAEAKPTDLAALALAWRGFAIGLNPSKK